MSITVLTKRPIICSSRSKNSASFFGVGDGVQIEQGLVAEDLEDVKRAGTVTPQTSGDGIGRVGVDAPDRQDDDERLGPLALAPIVAGGHQITILPVLADRRERERFDPIGRIFGSVRIEWSGVGSPGS